MSHTERISGLELEQVISFQQKTWVVQRVIWIILLVILGASALGFFGGTGLLAQAVASNDTLEINYKRFTHYLSPTDLQINVQVPENAGDTLRVWIDRQYLDGFVMQYITPEPDRIETAADRVIYEFALAENTSTISITFNVRHHQIGTLGGEIGIEDGQAVEFSHFVYP